MLGNGVGSFGVKTDCTADEVPSVY